MKKRKTAEYYIEKILVNIDFVIENMSGVTKQEFEDNDLLQDSMMFRLIQISEDASRIDDIFKEKYDNIPWNAMRGLRHRIVHDYGHIDLSIVFHTLVKNIPELKIQLSKLLLLP